MTDLDAIRCPKEWESDHGCRCNLDLGHVLAHACACGDKRSKEMSQRRSLETTAQFLRERVGRAPCDSLGVDCCVRCNVMYLVHYAEKYTLGLGFEELRRDHYDIGLAVPDAVTSAPGGEPS